MNGGAAGWLKQPATPIAAASIGAILLLSGLFVFFFHGSEKEDPNKLAHSHVEQTKTHLLKKDYDAAIREYGAAIRLDPDPAYLYSNRGNIYLTQKKYDKAIEDFGRGIKRDPKSVYLHTYRGQAHAARREADKAISDYGEAIRLGGRDADLFVRRGEAYMQEANLQLRRKPAVAQYYYRKALGDLDYALRVDPSSRSAVRRRQEALKGEKQAKAGAARQMFEAVKAGLKGEKQQAGVLSQSPSSSKGDPAEKKAPERRESTSQNGSRNSGTANSCFRVSHSSIPQISLQKMLRSDAERAKAVRSAIMKSGAADPLEFVWGAIPVERRSQSADGGWNEYFHVVERIDFRKPTRCVEGDFLYASIDALANGSVARENKRARNGPNVRLVRNWKELIIRYRDE